MRKFITTSLSIFLVSMHSFQVFGKAPAHDAWTVLLKKHVSASGKVDYKGFIKDSVAFNNYLHLLSESSDDKNLWSEDEQKTFWINTYNAYTIKLVLTYFPVRSIRDIGSVVKVSGVTSPWEIKFIQLHKEKLDLSTIENLKLRAGFNDPRIHFALVCASQSCPVLLNEAFDASKLEKQLDAQTKGFLTNASKNKIHGNTAELSKIFEWYASDFTKKGSLLEFVNKYSSEKIKSGTKILFSNYDWSLND